MAVQMALELDANGTAAQAICRRHSTRRSCT
jgi:hypothetical protein